MKRMMFMKRMIAMMAVVFSVAMFASEKNDCHDGSGFFSSNVRIMFR